MSASQPQGVSALWRGDWRDEIWHRLDQAWDVIVIGGGIAGAGVLREATRLGLRTLLVEQRDFGWGTSSRSSKLIHGGLRYLKQGKLRLTRSSIRARERLLQDGPGLIDPLGFLLTIHKGDRPGRWAFAAGLSVYDLLALRWDHRYYRRESFEMMAARLASADLKGGYRSGDAQTDDARLVLRVIREAVAGGGAAINYVAAVRLLRDRARGERWLGVRLRDATEPREADVHARVVINATGAWADRLQGQAGAPPQLRPLRGSHLIFPAWRLPAAQAISFLHPIDRRPVFIFPWEGITLVGTTDVDHEHSLDEEPRISPEETAYLMAAVEFLFPSLGLTLGDVIASFAGVRPVIGSGKIDPSKESRDHVIWEDDGLVTVTGGKLTTFQPIAVDTLKAVRHRLPDLPRIDSNVPVFNPVSLDWLKADVALDETARRRLLGRYGADAPALVAAAQPGELEPIPGTPILWAALRWAARAEGIVHLDDLLLRRVRLGLLQPQGGAALMGDIRRICQPELGWDDARWQAEESAYLKLCRDHYSLPDPASVPDWKAMLAQARTKRAARRASRRRALRWSVPVGALIGSAAGGWAIARRRRRR